MKNFSACVLSIAAVLAADKKPADVTIEGHVLRPAQLDANVSRLKVPSGFRVQIFAEGLGQPRILAVSEDGTVYVTRREPGDCLMLKDTDGDGKADTQQVVATKKALHGIAIAGNTVYLTTVKEIFRAERKPDGTLSELTALITDLPDGGQHPNRTLAVGPDGLLYVTVGSTCNACNDTNPESATILRMKPDGSGREVFAKGLRNTIGFGWEPRTKTMYGMDHGTDWLGDNAQNEELNVLQAGANYGWPYVYGQGIVNPRVDPSGGVDPAEVAKTSVKPVLEYTPHSAPMQMAFYSSSAFPEQYRGNAFVAMRGSWNRKPPSGYEVVQIRFDNGKPMKIEPFLTGFLMRSGTGWGYTGRPVGVAVAKDGSLLVSDDINGIIYRISGGK